MTLENRFDLGLINYIDGVDHNAEARALLHQHPELRSLALEEFRKLDSETATEGERVMNAGSAVLLARNRMLQNEKRIKALEEVREAERKAELARAAEKGLIEAEALRNQRIELARKEPALFEKLSKHARLLCKAAGNDADEATYFHELYATHLAANPWSEPVVPSYDDPWEDDAVPLIPELSLIRGRTLTLLAEQGRGKSTIVRWLAVCVAAGVDAGQFKIRNPLGLNTGKVVYIAAEQSVKKVANDIKRICKAMGLTKVPHVKIVKANNKSPEDFEAFLRQHTVGYDLVIVDTVRQFCEGEENDSTFSQFWIRAENVSSCEGYGFATIMIAHPGKGAAVTDFKFTDPRTARGSSSIAQATSYAVWQSSERGQRGIARSRWQWFDKCGRDSFRNDAGELCDVATYAEFTWIDSQVEDAPEEVRNILPEARMLRFDAFPVEESASSGELDPVKLSQLVDFVAAEEKEGRAASERGMLKAANVTRTEIDSYLSRLCEEDRLLPITVEAAKARGLRVNGQAVKVYIPFVQVPK